MLCNKHKSLMKTWAEMTTLQTLLGLPSDTLYVWPYALDSLTSSSCIALLFVYAFPPWLPSKLTSIRMRASSSALCLMASLAPRCSCQIHLSQLHGLSFPLQHRSCAIQIVQHTTGIINLILFSKDWKQVSQFHYLEWKWSSLFKFFFQYLTF